MLNLQAEIRKSDFGEQTSVSEGVSPSMSQPESSAIPGSVYAASDKELSVKFQLAARLGRRPN